MRTKKIKRIAAGLLAGIFLFGAVGCGKEESGSFGENNLNLSTEAQGDNSDDSLTGAKGRYIEALKATPEGVNAIEDMVRLSDGSVAFLNLDTGELHISKDNGDTWESKEIPAFAEKLGIEEIEITSNAVAPDGGVFFSYVNWSSSASEEGEGGSVREHYCYIDKDGNSEEITLTDDTGSYNFYLSDAVFTGDKTLSALMNGGSAYQIDLETKKISPVASKTLDDELVMGGSADTILEGDYILSAGLIYRVSASETIEDTVFCDFIGKETANYKRMAACFDPEENMVYTASVNGLYSHVLGGSTMEKLLDAGLCNLGDPTKSPVSILKNEDDSFLIAYDDGEIDQYTYDKEAPAVPEKQLTVYSLKQNMTVSKTISTFRKSHPDVYVKQEIGLSGDYGVTEEDAIRNLNTRLLTGEGPDILLLDKMPIESYIEKNILADISEDIGALEKEGNYFSNILRAYETEEGLYAVPIRYQIPILLGEAGNVENISDISSFAEAVLKAREAHANSGTVLGTYTAEELLKRLYILAAPSIKDGEKPNEEAVKEFLTKAAEIYEAEQKNITDAMLQQHNNTMVWREESDMMEDVENLTVNAGGVYDILAGDQTLMVGKLNGMTDFQMAEGMPENKEGMAYDILSAEDGKLFVPKGIAGISENTKERELAVEFLSELLGEGTQRSDLADGFPVNANAYDQFTQNPNPGTTIGFVASVANDDGSTESKVDFTATWPKDDAIAKLKEQIGTLKVPSYEDGVIYPAVLEIGSKVLEGDLSIEEGCNEIVGKVELYLSE